MGVREVEGYVFNLVIFYREIVVVFKVNKKNVEIVV